MRRLGLIGVLLIGVGVRLAAAFDDTAPVQFQRGAVQLANGIADAQVIAWDVTGADWSAYALAGPDFAQDDGTNTITLDPTITRMGSEIGNVSTELAGSTGVPSGACSPGQIHFNRNTGLTGDARKERVWQCGDDAADTWFQLGGLIQSGLSGGQTINGGTANADALTLEPTTSTTPTTAGKIRLCAASRTLDATDEGCASLLPNGATLTAGDSTWDEIGGPSAVVEHTASLFTFVYPHRTRFTMRAVGTTAFFSPAMRPYWFDFTRDNQNTNALIPSAVEPFSGTYSCSVTASGVAFTEAIVNRLRVGTIGTNCTVTDHYAGGNAELHVGTVNGTLTRLWGWHASAPTLGSNRLQFGAAEHTITAAAVPAGEVVWGAETGAPGRFFTINENEGRFYPGPEQSWTGSTNGLLGTGTGALHFPINGRAVTAAANGPNAAEGTFDIPAPCALQIHRMSCAVTAAPGGTSTRICRVREAAADTAVTCTIPTGGTTCSWCETGTSGCTTTGTKEAVAAGAMLEARQTGTVAPVDAEMSMVVHYSCDVW